LPKPAIASSPQLWRLNKEGRLTITDAPSTPILASEAHELISELAIDNAAVPAGNQAAQH
jgi:hypothetical protein